MTSSAMHFVNVMIPAAQTVVPGVWDVDALVLLLGKKVAEVHGCSERGKEVKMMEKVEASTGHHTEYASCGLRFVASACSSDSPDSIMFFKPSGEKRKAFEMLHMYNAQGLKRPHPKQQVILARVRDFTIAKSLVKAAQEALHWVDVGCQLKRSIKTTTRM